MTFSAARPWTVDASLRWNKMPLAVIHGDVMTLDDMFKELPNNHSGGAHTHGTIKSINKFLLDQARFADASSWAEMKRHVTEIGRDDITAVVTERLASPAVREAIQLYGSQRATRPRVVMGDDGEELDVDRYRLGEDDTAWRRTVFQETERRSKIVVIDAQVDLHGSAAANAMVWNGVQVAVIVDALEAEGYRVEVNAINVVSFGFMDDEYDIDGLKRACVRIRIKRAEDPLRLDLLAYQVGCAALERVAMWRCVHAVPEHWNIYGYGQPETQASQMRAITHFAAPEGAKPDHVLSLALTEAKALAGIREVMATYQKDTVDAQ